MRALSSLLFTLHREAQDETRPIAFLDGARRSNREFVHSVLTLAHSLERRPERSWGVFLDNGYDFAIGFLALLQAGKFPVLLPNAQPDFLQRLRGELDALLLPDPLRELSNPPSGSARPPRLLDPKTEKFALYTSGSTGEPKLIEKTLLNIEAELDCLEDLFGDKLAGACHLSTVSHQHIYGLLFSVLWPLSTARVFEGSAYLYPSDLVDRMACFSKVVLVSSPSHLNRFSELVDLEPHRERVAAVFSSGGPLPKRAALQVREALGCGVTEVFGSTESGGVGYRSQREEASSELWQPFAVLEVREDRETGKLAVRSPYIDESAWYSMEDRVEIVEDGRFRLLGRADRVVKVEGKRLSLQEVEDRLRETGLVEDARALLLSEGRSYVAVVLAPSKEGKERLGQIGAAKFKAHLKDRLAGYFERVLLPRKWRIVDEIPLNRLGKTTQESLRILFKQERTTEPTVLSVSESENRVDLDLHVCDSTKYFEGHFPGRPVLPGVAQLDWAARLGKRYLGVPGCFKKLEAVKFHEFILPDARIKLSLSYRPEKRKLYFTFEGEGCKHSSGRIVFG